MQPPSRSTLAGQALAAWRSSLAKPQLVSPLQSHLLNGSSQEPAAWTQCQARPEPGERPSGALVKQVNPRGWGEEGFLCQAPLVLKPTIFLQEANSRRLLSGFSAVFGWVGV